MRADGGVWVELKDNTKQGFLFTDKPKITYGTDILVLTSTEATVEFPFADIKRLYFSDDIGTAVNHVTADVTDKVIRATHEGARLSGFEASTPVTVYSLGGKAVQRLQVGPDGTLIVSLASLPKGTYVINAEKSTLKILKK